MKTEEFNKIVDEVYNHYLETHQYEPFILQEEMDLSKEDFIKKVTNNYGFGQLFGISLNERELSSQERNEWFQIHLNGNNPFMKSDWKDFELDQQNIPTKQITLEYNNEKTYYYE